MAIPTAVNIVSIYMLICTFSVCKQVNAELIFMFIPVIMTIVVCQIPQSINTSTGTNSCLQKLLIPSALILGSLCILCVMCTDWLLYNTKVIHSL